MLNGAHDTHERWRNAPDSRPAVRYDLVCSVQRRAVCRHVTLSRFFFPWAASSNASVRSLRQAFEAILLFMSGFPIICRRTAQEERQSGIDLKGSRGKP
jgi:hypothetical protein